MESWQPGQGKLEEMECHKAPAASQCGISWKVMDFSHTPLIPSGNHPDAYLQGLPLLPGAKLPVRNRSANAIRASPNTKWHLCLTNAVLFFTGTNLKVNSNNHCTYFLCQCVKGVSCKIYSRFGMAYSSFDNKILRYFLKYVNAQEGRSGGNKALIPKLFSALSAGLLITALCFDDTEICFWAFFFLFVSK